MHFVFRTPEFDQDLEKFGHADRIAAIEKSIKGSSTLVGFERFPPPFLKKRINNLRLVAELIEDGELTAVCFVRFLPRGDKAYSRFAEMDDAGALRATYTLDEAEIRETLRERAATELQCTDSDPSAEEESFLRATNNAGDGIAEHIVIETAEWVAAMQRPEVKGSERVIHRLAERAADSRVTAIHSDADHPIAILVRQYPEVAITILDSISVPNSVFDLKALQLRSCELSEFDAVESRDAVLRLGRRSYPAFILSDFDIWQEVQSSRDANLALSPEESELLQRAGSSRAGEPRFPLFINGRPGSGKSTILQYLFAGYLSRYLRCANATMPPPVYLTYGEGLLNRAKEVVREILKSNASVQAEGGLESDVIHRAIDQSMFPFREFMRARLPTLERERFNDETYVNFPRFKTRWTRSFRGRRDVLALGPELCWHVIRTYVKGMQQESGDNYDTDSYAEHPRKRRSVSLATFALVHEAVYTRWYRELRLWDDQDLVRAVLDRESNLSADDVGTYPGVFCDEAQDFTRQELEFIRSICLFAHRKVPARDLKNVPVAFAGDPFQTLNPTGFDWKAVQADFHESLAVRSTSRSVSMMYAELHSNYRSAEPIVQFCNAIQRTRINVFRLEGVAPQRAYFDGTYPPPEWYSERNPLVRSELQAQDDAVILVPCAEGGEEDYVESDPFLKQLCSNRRRGPVLSAMAAKGLEFVRVVLYKFGDEAVGNSDVADHIDPARAQDARHLDEEKETRLSAEYFLNRLYVAASRAREVLLIVDSDAGLGLWKRLISPEWTSPPGWSEKDTGGMVPGGAAGWQRRRDKPEELAENFFRSGQIQRSPSLMEVAARYFDKLDIPSRAAQARGLGAEYDGECAKAAALYREVGLWDDCVRCSWQTGDYGGIASIDAALKPENACRQRAAVALTRKDVDSAEVLRLIREGLKDTELRFTFVEDAGWTIAATRALSGLCAHNGAQATEYVKALSTLREAELSGFRLPPTVDLALVSARAGDHSRAAAVWNALPSKPEPLPQELANSLAQALPFPDNLPHLARLEKWGEIRAASTGSTVKSLTAEQLLVVTRAYLRLGLSAEAATVITEHGSTEVMERLLRAAELKSEATGRRWLVQRLLKELTRQRRFDVMARVLRDLDKDDGIRDFAHQVAARAVLDGDNYSDAPRLGRTALAKYIQEAAASFHRAGVGLEAGAVLERNGVFVESAAYYEGLLHRTRSAHEQLSARLRWAKVKRSQLLAAGGTPNLGPVLSMLRKAKATLAYLEQQPEFPPARDFPAVAIVAWPTPEQTQRALADSSALTMADPESSEASPRSLPRERAPRVTESAPSAPSTGIPVTETGKAALVPTGQADIPSSVETRSTPRVNSSRTRRDSGATATNLRTAKKGDESASGGTGEGAGTTGAPPATKRRELRHPHSLVMGPAVGRDMESVPPCEIPAVGETKGPGEADPPADSDLPDSSNTTLVGVPSRRNSAIRQVEVRVQVGERELTVLWSASGQFIRLEDQSHNEVKLRLATGRLDADIDVAESKADGSHSWTVPAWDLTMARRADAERDEMELSGPDGTILVLNLGPVRRPASAN